MTEPGRRTKPLSVVFWVLVGVLLAGAAGVVLFFTVVPARVQEKVPEPHVVGTEAPEIAARLEALTPAERAEDGSLRRAVAVSGAGATQIKRDGAGSTVIVQLVSPDPDHICYSFTIPLTGGPGSVRYDRLPSCPVSR